MACSVDEGPRTGRSDRVDLLIGRTSFDGPLPTAHPGDLPSGIDRNVLELTLPPLRAGGQ